MQTIVHLNTNNLTFFEEDYKINELTDKQSKEIFRYAAMNGQLLKCLFTKEIPVDFKWNRLSKITQGITFQVVKYLIEQGKPCTTDAVDLAVENDHLKIAELLTYWSAFKKAFSNSCEDNLRWYDISGETLSVLIPPIFKIVEIPNHLIVIHFFKT